MVIRILALVFIISLAACASQQPAAQAPTGGIAPAVQPDAYTQEQLQTRWRIPILAITTVSGTCKQVVDGKAPALAAGLMLKVAQDALGKWQPGKGQETLGGTIGGQIKAIGGELGEEDKTALGEICTQAEGTLKDIRAQANGEGLTDEDIGQILKEYQEKLKDGTQ